MSQMRTRSMRALDAAANGDPPRDRRSDRRAATHQRGVKRNTRVGGGDVEEFNIIAAPDEPQHMVLRSRAGGRTPQIQPVVRSRRNSLRRSARISSRSPRRCSRSPRRPSRSPRRASRSPRRGASRSPTRRRVPSSAMFDGRKMTQDLTNMGRPNDNSTVKRFYKKISAGFGALKTAFKNLGKPSVPMAENVSSARAPGGAAYADERAAQRGGPVVLRSCLKNRRNDGDNEPGDLNTLRRLRNMLFECGPVKQIRRVMYILRFNFERILQMAVNGEPLAIREINEDDMYPRPPARRRVTFLEPAEVILLDRYGHETGRTMQRPDPMPQDSILVSQGPMHMSQGPIQAVEELERNDSDDDDDGTLSLIGEDGLPIQMVPWGFGSSLIMIAFVSIRMLLDAWCHSLDHYNDFTLLLCFDEAYINNTLPM